MPSQMTSPPVTVTVFTALWVSLGRCGVIGTPWPGCDNGKFFLERDLPSDTVDWDCPGSLWPESTRRLPTIDTAYSPEAARQVCMDKPISYNHKIPNSGAYRPVRAESGEYLYCPPQRWLNNLHHGATVLLYHPCAPLSQRLLLAILARSCLADYIITPHPELRKHLPMALVSWGCTLELSTVATSDVCNWLETTATTRFMCSNDQSRKYSLLLTKPAMQHPCGEREQQITHAPTKTKESLRRCCEQTLSSVPSGAMEAEFDSRMKLGSMKEKKEEGKNRRSRAAIREKRQNIENENESENVTSHDSTSLMNQIHRTILSTTQQVQKFNTMLGMERNATESLPGTMNPSYYLDPRKAPSHPLSEMKNQNQNLTSSPTTLFGSYLSAHTPRPDSLGSKTSESKSVESQKQTEPLQPSFKHTDYKNSDPSTGNGVSTGRVYFERTLTTSPEAAHVNQGHTTLIHSAKHESTDRDKQIDKDSMKEKEKYSGKDNIKDDKMKGNEVVDVKEREVEHKQTHTHTHTHHRSEQTGFDSVPKTQSPPQSQQHQNPQPASYLPNTHNCGDCDPNGHCDCIKGSGAQDQAAVLSNGFPKTPRTDEALWAAAALGFLLILLTLSVLHTRLYRRWRTSRSLYWHDPRQDYDSVADVIRRRLQIAKRRRKRGRRQECVLPPSSSSSDET